VEISAREEKPVEKLTSSKPKQSQVQQALAKRPVEPTDVGLRILKERNRSELNQPTIATSLVPGQAGQNSLKRSYDMVDSSNEQTSAPLPKKQSIQSFDASSLTRKARIAVFLAKNPYNEIANTFKLNCNEFVQILEGSSPLHFLNTNIQQLHSCVNKFIQNFNIPEAAVEIEMSKPAKNSNGSLNTDIVAMQIKFFLFKNDVSQETFGKKNLGGMNKAFKRYLKEPIAWGSCTLKQQEMYQCCLKWVHANEEAVAWLKKE
jgi:hypothetical protein